VGKAIYAALGGYLSLKMAKPDYLPLGCTAICGGLLFLLIFMVTAEWVKVPAMNCAQHLLESAEMVLQMTKSKPGRNGMRK
jgi:hypothetical protein